MDNSDCELCGEPADDDTGFFQDDDRTETVWAHSSCGEDAGLELA